MVGQLIQKKQEEKQIQEDQAANARYWKILSCYDDDDDYNFAITPNEPVDSLIMGDDHLNTIPTTESDELIKSSVENLVPNPKSMLNHDSSIIPSSLKIDSLLDEFAGELTLLKSITSGIDETDCHTEKEIRLIEILFIEDSDYLMEEMDLSCTPDDPMPPSIEDDDDDDSKRDIPILEELLDNYSLSLPVNESFHFDIPLFSRPPAKPPDGDTGILNIKMMGDISDQKVKLSNLKQAFCGRHPMLILS
nr:hypothetical protein [Tanacetum cinerariifolium]